MANQKHLDILKQGKDTWDTWRRLHEDIRPDLSGANLSGASLSYAHFSYADLSGADLSHSDLRGVDLREADCSGAIFIKALH